jgi:hypothetical protein
MASAAVLYTPEVLALATALARYPLTGDLPLRGAARSPACGSRIELGLACDDAMAGSHGSACAPRPAPSGQASAAIFAGAASGHDRAALAAGAGALEGWLRGEAGLPDWPGLGAIAAARDYPGRHGAILLPWKAALEALPTA